MIPNLRALVQYPEYGAVDLPVHRLRSGSEVGRGRGDCITQVLASWPMLDSERPAPRAIKSYSTVGSLCLTSGKVHLRSVRGWRCHGARLGQLHQLAY